ncbi:hypothetical protein F7D01_05560 [Erythrobacter sp. 3-20A1M]|uniref:hypothetical protein n=1 Tax=Erythrobacter sp. 3-20A1M TaxID=2653850 RepID=UPI001C341399|nr:hypothetical protein [Erythrobacter sp. 3-20A1M]QWC56631.1 hypothetical protein F7D01_05560 [Erythrobacter sp. 3-20A1M]
MRILAKIALAGSLALGLAACGEPAQDEQDNTTDMVGATTAPETGVPVDLPEEPVETVTVPEATTGAATPETAPPVMSDLPGSPTPGTRSPAPAATPTP